MKYKLLLLAFVLSSGTLRSQVKFEIKPEVGFGLNFYSFTSDSLVPRNRANAVSLGLSGFVNLRINLQTAHYRWLFSTGTGITTNRTVLRENNGVDRFFAQFFSTNDFIKNILIKYQNLNLPVGVAYNLNRKTPQNFQAYVGLDAILQFNTGKQIKIYAPLYNYSDSDIKRISEEYKKRVEPVVIMLMPKFEFRTDLRKKVRHAFILSPFSIYSKTQLKGLTVNSVSMQMMYAVSFQLK
jgi:hypothetical protein